MRVESHSGPARQERIGRQGRSGCNGFSLLELLIVVAIILIVATIAIPALLRSRQAANESSAVATLRLIDTAQSTYIVSNANNFSSSLAGLVAEGLLDERFGSDPATVGGYVYTMTRPGGPTDFRVDAEPVSALTGRFDYYSLPDSVIRFGDDADNPLPLGSAVP